MVATTFAADTPLWVTEKIAQHGISGNWMWWNMLIGGMLTTFFFSRLWRRANILTELEFIELRYSGKPARFLRGFKSVYLGVFLNAVVIGWVSIIFGVLLWHADRAPTTHKGLDRIGWREAMIIGASQMLSLIPGVSRSGITMTAARYLGWTRPEAARFSMLLAIPTILALGFFAGIGLVREGAGADMVSAGIVAALSFLSAYVAIAFMMKLTQRVSFTPFVIYRIIFGVVILFFAGKLAGG